MKVATVLVWILLGCRGENDHLHREWGLFERIRRLIRLEKGKKALKKYETLLK
jgi:hypothetical protein